MGDIAFTFSDKIQLTMNATPSEGAMPVRYPKQKHKALLVTLYAAW